MEVIAAFDLLNMHQIIDEAAQALETTQNNLRAALNTSKDDRESAGLLGA